MIDLAEAAKIARWMICEKEPFRKRMAMRDCGSVQDTVHEVLIDLVKGYKESQDFRLTTRVVNQCRWTQSRLAELRRKTPLTKSDLRRCEMLPRKRCECDPVQDAELSERTECIKDSLRGLTYRQRITIMMRHGLGDGAEYSLEQVGRVFKITRESIRQIESKSIKKLQGGPAAHRLLKHWRRWHD